MLKNSLKVFIILQGLFLLISCHTNTKIENLPIRSSKYIILKRLGQPYKITWKDGKAHWSYRFIIEGRHYTRDLIIKEGILYKISGFKPFPIVDF